MLAIGKWLMAAVRTSEFWAAAAQAVVEFSGAPIPDEFKAFGWAYIALRVIGKLAKFVFPNPDNPKGGFLKND